MPIKSSDKQYNLRLDKELYARLDASAKRNRRSVNAEIILAVEKWLEPQGEDAPPKVTTYPR